MLECCNINFSGEFGKIINNNDAFYRRIEFGYCPVCGCAKYKDFQMNIQTGQDKCKVISGKLAEKKKEELITRLNNIKYGSKSNQNFYYGDYKITREKDNNGNPIYLQLRKNLNGQSEILGKVITRVYKND